MRPRPLPCAIAVMATLIGVKTVGLVHAVGVANPAHASTHEPQAKPTPPPTPPPAASAAAPAPPPSPPPPPAVSEAELATLQELRARRTALDARAAKLDEREALLSATERRLSERVQQLTALQSKLEQLEKDRQERQEANWRGLVRTYEDMRPRDAAAIFNDLDSAVLIPVLDRMKDAKAAPILAAMAPERARAATSQLAQFRLQSNAPPVLAGKEQGKP